MVGSIVEGKRVLLLETYDLKAPVKNWMRLTHGK
jgi:hypothetical protein